MDLVFKRYSSPFVLFDQLIVNKLFSSFIDELIDNHNEELMWEIYLQRVYDKSFDEFKETVQPTTSSEDIGTTIKKSYEMLNNFNPNE